MPESKTIYQKAVEVMPENEIGHWCSDLHLKMTPVSHRLVMEYEFPKQVRWFCSQIDGSSWYEIPFAYDPFWVNHEI